MEEDSFNRTCETSSVSVGNYLYSCCGEHGEKLEASAFYDRRLFHIERKYWPKVWQALERWAVTNEISTFVTKEAKESFEGVRVFENGRLSVSSKGGKQADIFENKLHHRPSRTMAGSGHGKKGRGSLKNIRGMCDVLCLIGGAEWGRQRTAV